MPFFCLDKQFLHSKPGKFDDPGYSGNEAGQEKGFLLPKTPVAASPQEKYAAHKGAGKPPSGTRILTVPLPGGQLPAEYGLVHPGYIGLFFGVARRARAARPFPA